MKRIACIVAALALGLVAPGCILTSGQIMINFDLPGFSATTSTAITGQQIDLSTEEEYQDNKDKLKDLADLAVLGKITNNGSTDIDVEVWMTPGLTTHATVGALKGDGTAMKLWGPFKLANGASKVVDWDESAKLFSAAGKAAVLGEAKGDGTFTIYAIAAQGTYDFSVDNGVLVLVIDVGI